MWNEQSGYTPSPERLRRYRQYEFFTYKVERKELFEYCQKVAEYLRSNQIPRLVIVDRSSRPLYIGVKEYLSKKYPDEKQPDIYFMNPKGFKAKEDLTDEEIEHILQDCEFKDDACESKRKIKSKEEILKELQQTYHDLMSHPDQPVLVFDTCIHSGKTLGPVLATLRKAGLQKVLVGSINPTDEFDPIKTDFYVTTERPEKGCYPFDRDKMIEKTFTHVYSKPTKDNEKREEAIRLREEIKKIIQEKIKDIEQGRIEPEEYDE